MFALLTTYFNICEKRYIYWDKEYSSSKMFMCKIVRRVMVIDKRVIQRQGKDTGFFNRSRELKIDHHPNGYFHRALSTKLFHLNRIYFYHNFQKTQSAKFFYMVLWCAKAHEWPNVLTAPRKPHGSISWWAILFRII